jgi:aspartyl-tRNA(Asn)/glutamyl-tRNA(Gln) amidotransferase subunit C
VEISREEVLKIADLAKLHFSESELDEFTSQFRSIIHYVEKLKEADVEGVAPTSHVSLAEGSTRSLFRDDGTRPSLPEEQALANAPDPGSGHFRVPKVL